MKKFEAYIELKGEMGIVLPDSGERFLLDSNKGYEFAVELLGEIAKHYPTMLKAVEQKIKTGNRSLFTMMLQQPRMYATRMSHQICSCCFGELDDSFDFDGDKFNLEYPRQCRELKFCPWNGYLDRNKDSFMVICGAKREFGLSLQERRVLLLVQSGITNLDVIADVMQLTKASIHKFMLKIHQKTGVTKLPDLINLVKSERI